MDTIFLSCLTRNCLLLCSVRALTLDCGQVRNDEVVGDGAVLGDVVTGRGVVLPASDVVPCIIRVEIFMGNI